VPLRGSQNSAYDASKRRDAIGAAAGFTEDGIYLEAGSEPVRGRAAIAATFAALWKSGVEDTGTTILKAEADGNLGYAVASVETNKGSSMCLRVLRRDRGRWGICAEAFI
jgi:ketosteroid isomerase-like protein